MIQGQQHQESPASWAHTATAGQLDCQVLMRLPFYMSSVLTSVSTGPYYQGTSSNAHIGPSAGPMSVCALVSSELVDQHTGVVVVVDRAFASADSAARRRDGTIGLRSVLQCTGLHDESHCEPRSGDRLSSALTLSSQVHAPPV